MTCSISGGSIAKYGFLEQKKLNWIELKVHYVVGKPDFSACLNLF
jgi:hypothetical protein